MWIKITPEMVVNMEIDLAGVSEMTRDSDVQLYEDVISEALRERLKKAFPEEDIVVSGVKAGIARERYLKIKAA